MPKARHQRLRTQFLFFTILILVGLISSSLLRRSSAVSNSQTTYNFRDGFKNSLRTSDRNDGLSLYENFKPVATELPFYTNGTLDGSGYAIKVSDDGSTDIGRFWQGCGSTTFTGGRYDCIRRYNYATFSLASAASLNAVHVWVGGFNNWGLPSEPQLKMEIYVGDAQQSANASALLATSGQTIVGNAYPTGAERTFTFASPVVLSRQTSYTIRILIPSGTYGDFAASEAYALYGGYAPTPPCSPSTTTATSLRSGTNQTVRNAQSENKFRRLIEKSEGRRVHIIVGLRVDYQPEGFLRTPRQVHDQRRAIAQIQDRLLANLSAFDIASLKKFSFVPAVALEADTSALTYLHASSDVLSIDEDPIVYPALAESTSLIGAPAAWAGGFTGGGKTVAILDSGVDKTHPFLTDKVVSEACYSSNLCPGGVTASTSPGSGVNCNLPHCEHGTHVAGIAAGKSAGFSGVAKDANIIAIQVFSQSDNGKLFAQGSDILMGLDRVQELSGTFDIAAVNLSLGDATKYTPNCDSEYGPVKAGIDSLRSLGIPTIVSAGNDDFTDGLSFPACFSTVVSVGSTDDGSSHLVCDDFGLSCVPSPTNADDVSPLSNSSASLSLLAPGRWIYSSIPAGFDPNISGPSFKNMRGTSQAAPHVTGAWAVLKSKSPCATVEQILSALTSSGVPVTDPRNSTTKSRIKVDAAVNALTVPVQTDATAVEDSPRGNPIQTLGTTFSGSFANLEVKYEGSCLPNSQAFYSLMLMEFPNSSYTNAQITRAVISVKHKLSSRCGTQTDLWTASDFSSTFTFDPFKFYAFMLYQLNTRPRGSEQDVYPQGCYDSNQSAMPSISCQQPTNLKDLYFVLTLNPTVSPPAISSIRPTSAALGGKIIINGSGFGFEQDSSFVNFSTLQAGISSWSNTQIVAFAPAGLQGTVPVSVTTSLPTSNSESFTYFPSPIQCSSIIRQQSGIDFCGEGLDVPDSCGSYGGGTAQLHRFAQVFTSQTSAKPKGLALKTSGFFGSPTSSVNFTAHIYDTNNPNNASAGNLIASTDMLSVPTNAEGQNILLNFSAAPPHLLSNHTYTWIVEVTSGNVGDGGLKGSNDDNNSPGGAASVWYQNSFKSGTEISGNNSFVPKYYYFVLCGELLPSADLSITKAASVNPAEVGRIFSYSLNISNAGPDAATDVIVTDVLPAGVTFTSATASQGSCTFAMGTVTCHLGNIAVNGVANVVLQVKPRQTGTLSNQGSVTSAIADPNLSNNSATVQTNVVKIADLKVTKTDSADPIFVDGQTTYTMLVTNLGTISSGSDVVLTDNLPPAMTFVSATTTQGSLVTPPVGATGIVTANLGSLAVNAQATVTITVKASSSGMLTNTAQVTGNEVDPNIANNTATQVTTVKDAVLLKILLARQVLTGGCENTSGNVYLTGPAAYGGVTVMLSSNISGATVPASVFIPAGQTVSPAFTLLSSPVTSKQVGLVTASSGAASVARGITINVGSGGCP